MNSGKQDADVEEAIATVVWLERLAHRCRMHGYGEYATLLRAVADNLNELLPREYRVDPKADECLAHVPTRSLSGFIAEVNDALYRSVDLAAATSASRRELLERLAAVHNVPLADELISKLRQAEERVQGIERGLRGMYAGTGVDAEDAFRSMECDLKIPPTRD